MFSTLHMQSFKPKLTKFKKGSIWIPIHNFAWGALIRPVGINMFNTFSKPSPSSDEWNGELIL